MNDTEGHRAAGPMQGHRAAGPTFRAVQGLALDSLRFQDVTTGPMLREWRKYLSWTIADASDHYGVSPRHWIRYESGVSPIPKHLTMRIAFGEKLAETKAK